MVEIGPMSHSVADLAKQNLLAIVAAYRKATGESLSEVSRKFYGKGNFFSRLKKGAPLTLSISQLDRILNRFRKEWPENGDWPLTRAIFMGRTRRG